MGEGKRKKERGVCYFSVFVAARRPRRKEERRREGGGGEAATATRFLIFCPSALLIASKTKRNKEGGKGRCILAQGKEEGEGKKKKKKKWGSMARAGLLSPDAAGQCGASDARGERGKTGGKEGGGGKSNLLDRGLRALLRLERALFLGGEGGREKN